MPTHVRYFYITWKYKPYTNLNYYKRHIILHGHWNVWWRWHTTYCDSWDKTSSKTCTYHLFISSTFVFNLKFMLAESFTLNKFHVSWPYLSLLGLKRIQISCQLAIFISAWIETYTKFLTLKIVYKERNAE
mgnify:CR=1 FL=1